MIKQKGDHCYFVCQQDADNPMGALADALESAGCNWTLFRADRRNSVAFEPDKHAGLIVLGGGSVCANDPESYGREKRWLKQADEARKPVLGICLGAQLLAHVCGGKVYREKVRDIGWRRVIATDAGRADQVLQHLGPEAELFQWHQDTCGLPACADNLATSSDAANEHSEAFRIGATMYGLQFHPEVTRAMLQNEWLYSPRGKYQSLARHRLDERLPQASQLARKMLDAWIQLAVRTGSAENRT